MSEEATRSPSTTQTQIPFSDYTNSLNSQYQEKIKQAAKQSSYSFDLIYEDGRKETQTYTKTKLLQWQFDEIEDLRSEVMELSADPLKARASAAKSRQMYLKAAQYLLFNTKTEKTMTEKEYKHCYFPDLRPVLDASILMALIPDPN